MPEFNFDPARYPSKPGCYLMKDASGQVIYVGKAKNLRRRLSSYFQRHRKRWRTERLVARIRDIEVIIVNSETESLVLENNLIKQHKPRYNRTLIARDTGYSYIVLTREEFPRLVCYKKHWINRALEGVQGEAVERRFGPYVNSRYQDLLLQFVTDHFRLRTCNSIARQGLPALPSWQVQSRLRAPGLGRGVRRRR